jgi:hypothetical protein
MQAGARGDAVPAAGRHPHADLARRLIACRVKPEHQAANGPVNTGWWVANRARVLDRFQDWLLG